MRNSPMLLSSGARCSSLLTMRIDEWSYDTAISKVREWCDGGSRYVCCSTAHMTMVAHDDPCFRRYVNGADMVVSDGIPIVWATRRLGLRNQSRVDAPTLTTRLCELAAKQGIPVGFYGSTPGVLKDLVERLLLLYPALNIAYQLSPPFRPLTSQEDEKIVDDITKSGVRLLFVGLGCPKQEAWMFKHKGRLPATMLGVGWTFDVLSGRETMAPRIIQRMGMEWLYRLFQNPKRVWRRTLLYYPRFVILALLQISGVLSSPLILPRTK
jgi:N-acetylglucosaminyldiphosphoundecaprenol N-acetyl-beta-D-mannosaminyltransferase